MDKVVYLFTDKFPFKGGEPFLETEIHYLSEAFDKVIIYPSTGHGTEILSIPPNVEIREFKLNHPVYLRNLFLKHWMVFFKWFVLEFIKSPHRIKYITEFNWNFKRLAGLVNNAVLMKKEFYEPPPLLYSYWFNDWASILTIAKQIGMKGELVCRTHGFDFDEQQQGRGYHPFRYVELPFFKKVLQVSQYGQNYIQKRFPNSCNIQVSKLGVIEKGNNPTSNNKVYQIVSCSNFVPLKRVQLIVEILSNFNIPFHWTHFGNGEGMVEVMNKALGILKEDTFTFKGYVANSELMQWYEYNHVDLFVNVSSLEGLPVSLMEAISFGIPVLGCRICGVPEIVNKQTGVLLDLDFEPAQAAIKIEEFLELNSRDENFRNGVKEFWKQNFDADKNYGDFVEVLKAI
jgi:glycosyltransferase involved in cell wall biosynthesis